MFRIPSEKQRLREELAHANNIIDTYEAQAERDRQWRLNSLPALLDAQRRAVAAEIERDQYAQRAEGLAAEVEALTARMRAPWVVLPSPGRDS